MQAVLEVFVSITQFRKGFINEKVCARTNLFARLWAYPTGERPKQHFYPY
jgi:hypothetical protein